tara:strand:+ start:1211 stop:1900 length:690 start_codon:yes stop_codon:yes gene_type:complete
MFDINFIDKPSLENIKEPEKIVLDSSIESNSKRTSKNIKINNKKSNLVGLVISIALIFFVFFSYKVFDYNSKIELKSFSINNVLKIINEYDGTELQSIYANDKEIRFLVNVNQSLFYDFLNLFKEINFNVKGSNNQSISEVYIDEIWHIESDTNLLSLRNFIKDFKGIESELLKDSNGSNIENLIVVSNFNNLISMIEILEKRNLIHSHAFKINKSINNPNYYEIIFYD